MILENIAQEIEKSGISRYRISKDTGVDQAALVRLMQGVKGCISLDKADSLCRYLGLELKPTNEERRG